MIHLGDIKDPFGHYGNMQDIPDLEAEHHHDYSFSCKMVVFSVACILAAILIYAIVILLSI